MAVGIQLRAELITFTGMNSALKAQEYKSIDPPATQVISQRSEPGGRLGIYL
jgi:hypothetical protein